MGKIEFIEHTADKGFRAEAESREKLFELCAEGLAMLLREDLAKDKTDLNEHYSIQLEADDITALLVDFLSEILTLSHIYNTVFTSVSIHKLTSRQIDAEIYGKKVQYFDEDIKAVTFHQADINQLENENFATTVVFDI